MAAVDEVSDKFIGKGFVFPIVLTEAGRPEIKGSKELLEASLRAILSTTIGTRFFLGEFGTKLEQLIQEPNDLTTQALVRHFTVEVIQQWEKRLQVLDVLLESRLDYALYIRIRYRITNTKIENSFIFPYYSQLIY